VLDQVNAWFPSSKGRLEIWLSLVLSLVLSHHSLRLSLPLSSIIGGRMFQDSTMTQS
jgi:hypothetical protein